MKPRSYLFAVLGLCLGLSASHPAAAAYRVAEGSAVRDKGQLTAGKDGAVLNFQSGLVIRLAPRAEFRQHKDSELWLDGAGKTNTESFTLYKGRADFRMPSTPGGRRAVMVRTSRGLLAASASGELTVLAEPETGVVAAYAGQVVVSTGGQWSKVAVGEAAVLTRSVPKIAMRALPAAPKILSGHHLWMALHGTTTVGGMEWSAGANDAAFKVVVRDRSTGALAAERIVREHKLVSDGLSLPGGAFALTVQSVDELGLAGPYSEAHNFTVVGVTEHRGARVDAAGTIHVGLNQRVQFTHVEGLQMNYGGGTPWAPATSSLVLYRHERTSVHFRIPESSELISAVVEPRGVVADVIVGSKLATWPGDTVHVSITLRDESGGQDYTAVEPKIDARLGIEPLPLEFRHDGSMLRAEIPPQPGPGPWVVRVTVVDQFGVELGRDSLEIAERGKSPAATEPAAVARASAPASAARVAVK